MQVELFRKQKLKFIDITEAGVSNSLNKYSLELPLSKDLLSLTLIDSGVLFRWKFFQSNSRVMKE